ncbi:hypothetical protein D3C74_402890 [compost metagenome]
MAADAFLIEDRPFIILLEHPERCIDEERHPVAGIEPENPVLDLALLNRKL